MCSPDHPKSRQSCLFCVDLLIDCSEPAQCSAVMMTDRGRSIMADQWSLCRNVRSSDTSSNTVTSWGPGQWQRVCQSADVLLSGALQSNQWHLNSLEIESPCCSDGWLLTWWAVIAASFWWSPSQQSTFSCRHREGEGWPFDDDKTRNEEL